MTDFSGLLKELAALGCEVDAEESRALVTPPDGTTSFVLLQAEEWIQVATLVVEENELRGSRGRARLGEFFLELHGRYLGCRFGYDEERALAIMTDVYPGNAKAKHIFAVMAELEYVATVVHPLIKSVLETDAIPPDSARRCSVRCGE